MHRQSSGGQYSNKQRTLIVTITPDKIRQLEDTYGAQKHLDELLKLKLLLRKRDYSHTLLNKKSNSPARRYKHGAQNHVDEVLILKLLLRKTDDS